MALFSPEVSALFAAAKKEELQKSLEGSYAQALERRKDSVAFDDPAKDVGIERLTLSNARLLSQALLHRAECLMRATGPMLASINIYGMALIARGHVETTAALAYFCNRISALEQGNIDLKKFSEDVSGALLGAKHDLFDKANAPVNILTCVEKGDKFIDKEIMGKKFGVLQDLYTWLSEFAHPNFCSNKCAFDVDKENHRMVLKHEPQLTNEDFELLKTVEMTASMFPTLFDEFIKRVEKKLSPT